MRNTILKGCIFLCDLLKKVFIFGGTQVLRGMPNGEGPKLVEREDGIDAMERFQFHENGDLRNMANGLVDTYFGEEYGLDE